MRDLDNNKAKEKTYVNRYNGPDILRKNRLDKTFYFDGGDLVHAETGIEYYPSTYEVRGFLKELKKVKKKGYREED